MYISAESTIGGNVAYTLGIISNSDLITFVGWCAQTGWYEEYEDSFLETSGNSFIGYVPTDYFGSEELASIAIPKFSTYEQAESEIPNIQEYYEDALSVIPMVQDTDGSWVPEIGG